MLNEETRRAIIVVELDAGDAEQEVSALSKIVDKSKATFEKFADTASKGLGKVADFAKRMGDGVNKGVGKIDDFAKKLAPWNQAVELAGKVVRVADAGLDAYAKTSAQAAEQVKELRDELGHYKDMALEAVGATTVATLSAGKFGDELIALRNKARELENNAFFKRFFFDPMNKASFGGGFFLGDDEGGKAAAQAGIFDTLTAGRVVFGDIRDAADLGSRLDRFLAKAKADYDKAREVAKQLAEERKKLANDVQKALTDQLLEDLGDPFTANELGPSAKLNDFAGIDTSNFDTPKGAGKEPSILDRLGIGDDLVDQLDIAKTALTSFKDAYAQTVEAIASGSMTAGQAFKKGIGMILNAVGQKLAGLAAAELIEAGAHLFLLDPAGAAMHAGAAAIYTTGAGLLFGAAAKLGGGGSASAPARAGGGSSAGASSSSRSLGGGRGGGGEGGDAVYIIVGDSQADDSPRIRQRNAERTVSLGLSRTSVGGAF